MEYLLLLPPEVAEEEAEATTAMVVPIKVLPAMLVPLTAAMDKTKATPTAVVPVAVAVDKMGAQAAQHTAETMAHFLERVVFV
jgi:hypothetical protein